MTELIDKIKDKKVVIVVIGLGRVGLPLASVFANCGIKVIGIEKDEKRAESISKAVCPFHDPPLQENLEKAISLGNLHLKNQLENINEDFDIIFITVGTPNTLENTIDYSQLYAALDDISKVSLKEKIIVLRSTLPPNTTEEIVIPFFESKSGLKCGQDFWLAFCPERILEGRAITELKELPEIIGGVNEHTNNLITALFKIINPDKEFSYSTPTGAEMAKLFTNIYRYISFALSNEFAIWAEQYGLDASEIIKIANYKYSRSNIPIPGFVGGPCLTKDGTFLDNNTTFIGITSTAWKLNEAVPNHIANRIKNIAGSLFGKKIAVLGVSFKAGSDDTRQSPSLKMIQRLKSLGANVLIHDPYVKETLPISDVLKSPDIVIIATNHKEFKDLASEINNSGCKLVYDVWSMFDQKDFSNVKYVKFGQG